MVFRAKKPKVIHLEVIDGRLFLTLDWFGIEATQSIITKTTTGFLYENVGLMRRELSCQDEILEEIECSDSLKEMMEKLTVINVIEQNLTESQ
ncbi:MAG: hypothetical protein IH595_04325 [Bacteroidales bacterium]|nr:hypothetical protein [Bacteroidales bacterium]